MIATFVASGAYVVPSAPAFAHTRAVQRHAPPLLDVAACFDIDIDSAAAGLAVARYELDERTWFKELKAEMQIQKDYMTQCYNEEECHLENAEALEDNFSKRLLLQAAEEVSPCRTNAFHTHTRHADALARVSRALCSQRREEAGEIKQFLQTLREQRRAAVAMLWDDRRLGATASDAKTLANTLA